MALLMRLRWPVLVFVLALVPRGVYLSELAQVPTFDAPEGGDSAFYHRVASGQRTGRAYFHSPGYQIFVAGVYGIFGPSLWALRMVQFVIGALAAVLAFLLVLRVGGRLGPALFAGALYALCGPLIFYEGQLLPAAILPALMLATALGLERLAAALEHANQRRTLWLAGVLGLLVGFSALVRPTALLFAVALAVYLFRRASQRVLVISVFSLALCLVVAPVTVSNLQAEDDLVLITANGGLNLYIGNNRNADGTYNLPAGLWFRPGDPKDDFAGFKAAEHASQRRLTSAEVSSWWRNKAMTFIAENPGTTAWLVLRKLALWFSHLEQPQLYDYRGYAAAIPILEYLALGGPVIFFGVIGMIGLWREVPRARLWVLCAALLTVSFLPFFVVGRYRAPWLALLIPAAAWGLWRIPGFYREATAVHRALGVAAALGLSLLVFWPARLGPPAAQWLAFGRAAERRGRVEQALAWYGRAADSKGHWAALRGAERGGRLLLARNDLAGAERLLQAHREAGAKDAKLQRLLGELKSARGETAAARRHLGRSLELDPGCVPCWLSLARLEWRAGRRAIAHRACRSALALDPKNAAARELSRRLLKIGPRVDNGRSRAY